MRKEYDFSAAEPKPYARRFKRQVTLRLEEQVIDYFKELAMEVGVPYQTLINFYLKDCVETHRRPKLKWA